jgi:hypothetical protein
VKAVAIDCARGEECARERIDHDALYVRIHCGYSMNMNSAALIGKTVRHPGNFDNDPKVGKVIAVSGGWVSVELQDGHITRQPEALFAPTCLRGWEVRA